MKINWRAIRLDDAISILLLLSLVGTVALQVVSRYGFGAAISWTEELARVQLIVLTFFATSSVVRRSSHMGLSFFVELLPPQVGRVVYAGARFAEVVFYAVAAWAAWQMAVFSQSRNLVTLPISRGAMYGLVAFALVLATVRAVQALFRRAAPRELSEDADPTEWKG